jgi:hypothetical protein
MCKTLGSAPGIAKIKPENKQNKKPPAKLM